MKVKAAVSTPSSRAAASLHGPLAGWGGRRLVVAAAVGGTIAAVVAALVVTTRHERHSRAPALTPAAHALHRDLAPVPANTRVRVFGWAPVRHAAYYDVRLFRAGAMIFEARTSATRIGIPRRWTADGRRFSLRPGRYVWQVRPGFGPRDAARYGAPVVQAKLVVGRHAG